MKKYADCPKCGSLVVDCFGILFGASPILYPVKCSKCDWKGRMPLLRDVKKLQQKLIKSVGV